jgi:hypothetical protein
MPGMKDKIKNGIGAAFGQFYSPPASTQQSQQSAPKSAAGASSPGKASPTMLHNQGADLNLVSYSPEENMQQIEQSLSNVHFGMSTSRKIKEYISEFWSVVAPLVLCGGTVGEVYFFIASNMVKGKDGLSWWVVVSIIATILALEVSFMVVSMKSDTIRNDLREKGGGTAEEKKELLLHRISWFVLAFGVAIGQISFLVVSLKAGMLDVTFIALFSVGRSVFTLAADFYVAFVHKAMPTSAEQQNAMKERRGKAVAQALEQRSKEITIINDGQLRLREAHAEAKVKDVEITTMIDVKTLQAKAQVDTLLNAQKQNELFQQLQNNVARAMLDPTFPEEDRDRILGVLEGLRAATKRSPGYSIEEQKDNVRQLKGL